MLRSSILPHQALRCCTKLAARELGCRPVSVAACRLLSHRSFKTQPFEALGVCAFIPRNRE
eukprot:14407172-Alexandrium_andersonii.AAC.1